jgi:hypothetical protein
MNAVSSGVMVLFLLALVVLICLLQYAAIHSFRCCMVAGIFYVHKS